MSDKLNHKAYARKADKVVINKDGTRTFYVKDFTIDGVQVSTSAKIVWGGIDSEVFNCGDHFEIREIFKDPKPVLKPDAPKVVEETEIQENIMTMFQKAYQAKTTLDELKKLAGPPLKEMTAEKDYRPWEPTVSTAEIMFDMYCKQYKSDFEYEKVNWSEKIDTVLGEMRVVDIIDDIANSPKYVYEFALYTERRFLKGEKTVHSVVEYAVKYAVEFLDGRFDYHPELETKILDSKWSRMYLDWVVKNKPRWDLEQSIREQHKPFMEDLEIERYLERVRKIVNVKPDQNFSSVKCVGNLDEIVNPDELVHSIVGALNIDEIEAKKIADDMRNAMVSGSDYTTQQ